MHPRLTKLQSDEHTADPAAREASRMHGLLELQRSAGNRAVRQALDGREPLPVGVRRIMEKRFGTDLSSVRVHTGPHAWRRTREVGAEAYTQRHEIYFGPGGYPPRTRADEELLAHELAHVAQQSRAAPTSVSAAALEREADEAAAMSTGTAVLSGAPAGVIQKRERPRHAQTGDVEKDLMIDSLYEVPQSFGNWVDNPKFEEVLDEHPDLRQLLWGLDDFRHWVRDKSFRPSKYVSPSEERPMEERVVQPEPPPVFSEFPPLRPVDAPPPKVVRVPVPTPSAREQYLEAFERKPSLKEKGEARIRRRFPRFWGTYEKAAARTAAETKQMIGAFFPIGGTLGWDVAEFATGETTTGDPISRLEKSKSVLLGTAATTAMFLPEGKLVPELKGMDPALKEGAALLPEEIKAAEGLVQEVKAGESLAQEGAAVVPEEVKAGESLAQEGAAVVPEEIKPAESVAQQGGGTTSEAVAAAKQETAVAAEQSAEVAAEVKPGGQPKGTAGGGKGGVEVELTEKQAERLERMGKALRGEAPPETVTAYDKFRLGRVYDKTVEELVAHFRAGNAEVLHYVEVDKALIDRLRDQGGRVLITEGTLTIEGKAMRFDFAEINFNTGTVELIDLTSVDKASHIAKSRLYKDALSKLTGFPVDAMEMLYAGPSEELLLETLTEIPVK